MVPRADDSANSRSTILIRRSKELQLAELNESGVLNRRQMGFSIDFPFRLMENVTFGGTDARGSNGYI